MGSERFFTHIDSVEAVRNVDVPGWNPLDQGVMKILVSSQTGSRDLYLGIGWLQPGETHLLHHHVRESEFYFVVEGSPTVTVGDQTETMTAGGAAYIPAGLSHSIENQSPSQCVVLFGYNRPEYENFWD